MRAATILSVLVTIVGIAACGGDDEVPAGRDDRALADARLDRRVEGARGVAVVLPVGWRAANESLTPALTDPREVLAVATFPLRHRESGCAHVAGAALSDLGPQDAFVTLQERGLDPGSTWPDFPARPARFGPSLGVRSEAAACVPSARFTDHWFGFTDADRHFHVLVAFGPDASPAVRDQAWRVLDSLQIDPNMPPDWRAAGKALIDSASAVAGAIAWRHTR
jgi:hypothetical protein